MLKVYTKNGIELIDESLNTKFNDYEINFEKNFIIDSNNNLVYSVNGAFVGKILGDNDVPHIVLPYCYLNESPIPTDITVDPNWSKFTLSMSVDQDCFVYGARTSSTATDKLEVRVSTASTRFNTTIGSNSPAFSYVTDLSSRSDMINDGTDITTTNSGTTTTVSVGSTPGFVACSYPVCIGGIQNGNVVNPSLRMKGYFWKNEIEINNVLAHRIIPVKMKSDNSICLYDEITKKYYTALSGTTILEERPTPVPSQYIIADTIQIPTTGYINTEIPGSPRYTRSKFKVTWVGSSAATRGLYGVRATPSSSSTSYNVYLVVNATGPRWDNTGATSFFSNWQVNETHEVELTQTPEGYGQAIVDGNIVATGNTVMDPDYINYIHINTLFTAGTSATAIGGTMKWHDCQIWGDGNTLSADFVPVYDTLGQEAGLYDIVRQRFFGNNGSGTITAYDANGDPITGGNLLNMSPNMLDFNEDEER